MHALCVMVSMQVCGVGALELGLQELVSLLMWGLGTELRMSERAEGISHH